MDTVEERYCIHSYYDMFKDKKLYAISILRKRPFEEDVVIAKDLSEQELKALIKVMGGGCNILQSEEL